MRKAKKLPVVEIISAADDAAILEELITAEELSSSAYLSRETGLATTYIFVPGGRQAKALLTRLQALQPQWQPLLSAPLRSISCRSLQEEDWSESWKKHFHTFKASPRLVVKPSWEQYNPLAGEKVLTLDPGMCFGTGYHGTTRACLKFLDDIEAEQGGGLSFLDAGCGSGILSMGAGILGYAPVYAFDYDPQAVETTRENLSKAGLKAVSVQVAEIKDFTPPQPCRVVAANILASVLLENAERIMRFLAPHADGSFLLLSGILSEQYCTVRERFAALGAQELTRITLDEWTSGCYRFRP